MYCICSNKAIWIIIYKKKKVLLQKEDLKEGSETLKLKWRWRQKVEKNNDRITRGNSCMRKGDIVFHPPPLLVTTFIWCSSYYVLTLQPHGNTTKYGFVARYGTTTAAEQCNLFMYLFVFQICGWKPACDFCKINNFPKNTSSAQGSSVTPNTYTHSNNDSTAWSTPRNSFHVGTTF